MFSHVSYNCNNYYDKLPVCNTHVSDLGTQPNYKVIMKKNQTESLTPSDAVVMLLSVSYNNCNNYYDKLPILNLATQPDYKVIMKIQIESSTSSHFVSMLLRVSHCCHNNYAELPTSK